MKVTYSVTFEFLTTAPVIHRGIISAISPRTLAARAIDEAIEKNPNLNWRSLVIYLNKTSDS